MGYRVVFVADDDLTEEQHWFLVREPDTCWLFIKASRVTPAMLEDAWYAYGQVMEKCPPPRGRGDVADIASPGRPYRPGRGLASGRNALVRSAS